MLEEKIKDFGNNIYSFLADDYDYPFGQMLSEFLDKHSNLKVNAMTNETETYTYWVAFGEK